MPQAGESRGIDFEQVRHHKFASMAQSVPSGVRMRAGNQRAAPSSPITLAPLRGDCQREVAQSAKHVRNRSPGPGASSAIARRTSTAFTAGVHLSEFRRRKSHVKPEFGQRVRQQPVASG